MFTSITPIFIQMEQKMWKVRIKCIYVSKYNYAMDFHYAEVHKTYTLKNFLWTSAANIILCKADEKCKENSNISSTPLRKLWLSVYRVS
jgi:hypothetical protein